MGLKEQTDQQGEGLRRLLGKLLLPQNVMMPSPLVVALCPAPQPRKQFGSVI